MFVHISGEDADDEYNLRLLSNSVVEEALGGFPKEDEDELNNNSTLSTPGKAPSGQPSQPGGPQPLNEDDIPLTVQNIDTAGTFIALHYCATLILYIYQVYLLHVI